MPRDKSSKRRERKMLDYKERPYKNSLASASFILNPDFARAAALTLHRQSDYDRAIEKAFDAFGLDPERRWLQSLPARTPQATSKPQCIADHPVTGAI